MMMFQKKKTIDRVIEFKVDEAVLEERITGRWIHAASGRSYRGAALYYAVSSDAGATFAGDFKAADHTCECCRIALAPAAGGGVHGGDGLGNRQQQPGRVVR
mgnify:CR=1 FL=1